MRERGDPGRRLTSAERLEIWRHIAAGETNVSAAAAVGCSTQAVGQLLVRTGGLAPRTRPRSPLRLSVAEREEISGSTIWRWLADDALRPWTHRSWIFPRDPDFARKAGVALDLYARRYQGQKLGLGEYVLCADEKTSIQARVRCHPSLAASPGHAVRVEHEYERGRALAYLAAWDVHRARLFGRLEPTTGIAPFGRLVDQVMAAEPYRSAERVFLIVDNGTSHRGERAARRLAEQYPNLVLVHLPVHASWLNQIEIYFSIVQRKVLTPSDSLSLDELAQRILDFQARYEESAVPFEWKFTRRDLDKLLRRIAAHEQLPVAA